MRIAIMGIKGIPARFGGWETVVEELSTRLATKGYEVTVYNRSTNVGTSDKYYKGVRLIKLPTLRSKDLSTMVHTLLATIHVLFTNADVVHYYTCGVSPLTIFPRIAGKKTILSVDGLDWQRDKWSKFIRLYLKVSELFAVYFPDEIITDAKIVEKYYFDKYRKRSVCIAYGANIMKSSNPGWIKRFGLEKEGYILFVGRLTPENKVHDLISAFERVRTDLKLVIVGNDPWHKNYINSLKRTNDSRIMFPGAIYGEGYRELNCNAYLFVLPDAVGGTHPALIEAMALGNCVLVNDTPANLEVIGDAGLYYDGERGAEDLARQLQRLIDNPGLVKEYRKKAVQRVKRYYQWDQVVEEHEKIYNELLNR